LYVVLPGVGLRHERRVKIEITRGRIWISGLRIHIDDFLADGVLADEVCINDMRDCEVRAITAGIDIKRVENVLKRVAEVSGAFERRGDEGVDVDRVALPSLFEIHEEECLSLFDGSAEGKAVLIARVVRIWDSLSISEKFVRIQRRTLAKPPTAPMKLVTAFFQNDVNDGAAVTAVFGGKTIILDFELLNDFHRRCVISVSRCAFALFGSTGECPVNSHFRRGVALPV